ncbi:hypothetical protein WME73_17865 [Sorangium sp. So ce302]|uniref:hypothetical protein n=1 Tax=Sorangium sp. So ce302 TaxID=3133297 RepID=UPI003F63842F
MLINQSTRRILSLLILSSALGCGQERPPGRVVYMGGPHAGDPDAGESAGASAPEEPPEPYAPPALPVIPVMIDPGGAHGFRCAVRLRLDVSPVAGERRLLRVVAENATGQPLALELPDRCPNGLVELEGLGPGYDYYGTCNAGPCLGVSSARRIELGPGEARPIAEATIALRGAPPCTSALPPGQHVVRAGVRTANVPVCTAEAVLDVPGAARPQSPPSPPPPSVPSRSTPASSDPYACQSPTDCVLSCPEPAGCCGWPCGCQHAIHRDHRAVFEANFEKTCTRPPRCPVVGCAFERAVGATCRNGRCVATTTLGGL